MIKDNHDIILFLEEKRRILIDNLKDIDNCVTVLTKLFNDTREPQQPKAEKPVQQTVPDKRLKGQRGRGKNKYKGVQPLRPLKDGTQRWRARVWDGRKKTNVTIGDFDTPELASNAYKNYKADKIKKDAQTKADMQEQAENNPDRPGTKMKVWICTHCKLEHKYPTQPTRCARCDGATFKDTGRKE